LEFLNNKKHDIEIPRYFMNQLSMFESRLSKQGQGPKSNSWDEKNYMDIDELLVQNTYLNGLPVKQENRVNRSISFNTKKIQWADNNNLYRRDLLCSVNLSRELVIQKDVRPIVSHKQLRPKKGILKRVLSAHMTPTRMSLNGQARQKDSSFLSPCVPLKNPEVVDNSRTPLSRPEREDRVRNMPRSFSLDNRGRDGGHYRNESSEVTNIIIAPNMKNIINNNIKNIYINDDSEMDKIANKYINYEKMEPDRINTKISVANKLPPNTRDSLIRSSTINSKPEVINIKHYQPSSVNSINPPKDNPRLQIYTNYLSNPE
jgi:hypothetical protein